jgi:hypothetical protein
MATLKTSSSPKKTNLIRDKIVNFWHSTYNWFTNTPERALAKLTAGIAQAYKAAENIREIENEYFNGNKITPESISPGVPSDSPSIIRYWQTSLNTNLKIIKIRLAEYRLSFPLTDTSNQELVEQLKFIDDVIGKYLPEDEIIVSNVSKNVTISAEDLSEITRKQAIKTNSDFEIKRTNPVSQKTGILPRSIGRTINRISSDFSPQAEEKFVQNFRNSRKRTQASIKFLLMLIIIPLLTHQLAKQLLIFPLVEQIRGENTSQIFLNTVMEDEALKDLKIYEEELKFESLILQAPKLSPEKIEEKVKEKAIEIAAEFRIKSSSTISNVFADIASLIAFAIVVVISKGEIEILKSFIDEVFYGLSDSAKAFLIILFTDIFVGFHSPHGWEVILEGVAEHLGLPPNRSAMSLFIATFPVVLDTISKYWIFRYLSRLSPSALATLKEMNE